MKQKKQPNLIQSIVSRWPLSRRMTLIAGGLGVVLIAAVFVLCKTQLTVTAQYATSHHKVDAPFVVTLNQALASVSLADIKMTPKIPGAWHHESGRLIGRDKLIFTPTSYFTAGTKYTVTVPHASRLVAGSAEIDPITFTTEKAPGLAPVETAALSAAATVAADYPFVFRLSAPNRKVRTLELRTTPAVPMTLTVKSDQVFTWTPTQLLPQGTDLKLELYDTKNREVVTQKTVKVAPEPSVEPLAKSTRLGETEPITITFSQPIDPKTEQFITVDTPGSGTWKSDTTYVFTPTKLQPGKTYNVVAKPGLRSKAGGIVTADRSAAFSTMGAVIVSAASPRGNNLAQASQVIRFTFDQPVDQPSAESRFAVSSGTIRSKQWQGNTLVVTVDNLGFQHTVTASIAAGVANSGFGLPSSQTFTVSFTTETRSVRLTIPYYRQQYASSCTAASLRMILASKGIMTNDMDIVQRMGYAPRPIDKSTNPPTWDDPREMFVGSIDGTLAAGTGAGVDAQPVAKSARSFGVGATATTGASAQWIAAQLHAGRPVIMFGVTRSAGYTTWKTPAGALIKTPMAGHARVVTGVQGEPDRPIGFWVHDPLYGSRFWTAGELAGNIAQDPDRQAVVIQ